MPDAWKHFLYAHYPMYCLLKTLSPLRPGLSFTEDSTEFRREILKLGMTQKVLDQGACLITGMYDTFTNEITKRINFTA